MTWREKNQPKEGDLRVRSQFLFFPMTIEKQTRWFERGTWVELYQRGAYGKFFWVPLSWRTTLPSDLPADVKGFWRNLYRKFFNQHTDKIDKITL